MAIGQAVDRGVALLATETQTATSATPIADSLGEIVLSPAGTTAAAGVSVSALAAAGAIGGEMVMGDIVDANIPFGLGKTALQTVAKFGGGALGALTGAAVFEGSRQCSKRASRQSSPQSASHASSSRSLQLRDLRQQLHQPQNDLTRTLSELAKGKMQQQQDKRNCNRCKRNCNRDSIR